jgi:glycosyltransferase involved in cell wall biosynthesis
MPARPRILMVSGEAPPLLGGVGDSTDRLLQALARLRPDWHWLWLTRRPRLLAAPFGRRGAVRVLRPVHRWDRPWSLAAAVAARLARPGLVHVQEELYSFFESDAAVRIARATAPAPLVVTLHEYHDDRPGVAHTRALVGRARFVMANDRRTADRCAALAGRAPDRVLWSVPTVEPPEPSWGVRPVPGLVTTFGFVGALKSLEPAFHALARLRESRPGLRWRIVGPFDPAANPDHAALAARLAAPWVEFTGALHGRELRTRLAESSLMLLPFADGASTRRGSLQVAWAFGLPVVTTAPGAPEPALLDGENCLLAPGPTAEALAAPIARALDDPALAGRLRAGSLGTAARFSPERQAELHVAIYESLLAAPGRAPGPR